jgi:hypothetical protein
MSDMPQGPILGPQLLNILINSLYDSINCCLLFADDLKVYRALKSLSERLLLKQEIVYVIGV